jgi:hypothetical protein
MSLNFTLRTASLISRGNQPVVTVNLLAVQLVQLDSRLTTIPGVQRSQPPHNDDLRQNLGHMHSLNTEHDRPSDQIHSMTHSAGT